MSDVNRAFMNGLDNIDPRGDFDSLAARTFHPAVERRMRCSVCQDEGGIVAFGLLNHLWYGTAVCFHCDTDNRLEAHTRHDAAVHLEQMSQWMLTGEGSCPTPAASLRAVLEADLAYPPTTIRVEA